MRQARRTANEKQQSLERLKARSSTQAGAVHRADVLDAGFTEQELQGLVGRGKLEPRFRWTYVFPGRARGLDTRCWCGVLSAGEGALVTGAKALALMGALPEPSGPIECIRRTGRPRPQPGLLVRREPQLSDADAATVRGIPTATFARSLLDFARGARADDVDRALDTGARLRLFNGRDLERLQQQVADHPGEAVLTAALARLDATTGLKRSELERRLIKLITESDLPTPLVNSVVHGFEVDIRLPGTRGIIEADGREYHSSPADIARDIEKRRILEDLGFVIQLFDWEAVNYRPAETLQIARTFMAANMAPPVPRRKSGQPVG